MIKKIDISKFGLFRDFCWPHSISDFSRVNILYGRNYSGKTTLSRIFRCAENNAIHPKYADGRFTITYEDTTTITEANLNAENYIRVYNSDFVKDNLSFLYDNENGDVKPFTLIGVENNLAQQRIDEIDVILGSVEDTRGKRYELSNVSNLHSQLKRDIDNRSAALESSLRTKANTEIKTNKYYIKQGANYNIANIKQDIEYLKSNPQTNILADDIRIYKQIIDQEGLANIDALECNVHDVKQIILDCLELVGRNISVSKTIQEFVENQLLNEWVSKGRDLHSNSKGRCLFCGNILSEERWDELGAHFSRESELLKSEIESQKQLVGDIINSLLSVKNNFVAKEMFYPSFIQRHQELKQNVSVVVDSQVATMGKLITELDKRYNNIFAPHEFDISQIEDFKDDIDRCIADVNILITDNNDYTTSLSTEQNRKRKLLRLFEIQQFITTIDYVNKIESINSDTNGELNRLLTQKSAIESEVCRLESERRIKEQEKKDEGKAADKINELLSCYFGHSSIQLSPTEIISSEDGSEKRTKFIIQRDGVNASNLSEGECSLVSFCYFIAKMEDELKDDALASKLAIYIDDPISSLDNNHIFFMFSLIESKICKGKKYGQLFISTHNLDFLKYIKRLTIPGTLCDQKDISYYSIVRREKPDAGYQSVITGMDRHLRDNVTEYNFLFSEIYKIAKPIDVASKIGCIENTYFLFYNLANNMRRFLECYLAYRLPNTTEPLKNINLLFDAHELPLINRIINEYSHLTWGDRGTLVMDVPEAENVAKIILKSIKERDEDHFNALCQSVGIDNNIAL